MNLKIIMRKCDKLWHGGKGDNPRPVDKDKYADGWERIFGNKDDINRTEADDVRASSPPKHNN